MASGLELEHDFESYNRRILDEKLIHPDDEELYAFKNHTVLTAGFLFGGKKQLTYQFRRQLDNEYISTTMEFPCYAQNYCCYHSRKNSLRYINPWIVVHLSVQLEMYLDSPQ